MDDDITGDSASNPLKEDHLPVGGEIDMHDGSSVAPDIADDMHGDEPVD